MRFSIIISIFNRKLELNELLLSLSKQTFKKFEIIIIDDGSSEELSPIIYQFINILKILYVKKTNTGPGLARNFGAKLSKNEYLIFLDSDCVLPQYYLEIIHNKLNKNNIDCYGGPDKSREDFTLIQKSISYAMTSLFTTGGIRGSRKSICKFQPRGFNMGIKREIFNYINGFSNLKIGEDSDLIMKLWEQGFTTKYFFDVYVYHKRRNNLLDFIQQIYHFGKIRPILNYKYPQYKKNIFYLPTIFVLFSLILLILLIFFFITKITILIIPCYVYFFYFLVIFIHSSIINKNIKIGILSIITSFIQLFSYGIGFAFSFLIINFFKKKIK